MSVIIAWFLSNPTILAIGAAIIGALGFGFQQRRAGAKAEKAKQAAAETKAINSAKQVQDQVDAMKPDDARKELREWKP